MKNQVLLVIFLFFGFAFLVYLFPVIFVEGAKLESGVTIKAPSTTQTEMICDDTIDNDDDGKIDAADEDCAIPDTGPPSTCKLQIEHGVPINYGQLKPGQESQVQLVVVNNVGFLNGKIMVKGGDWISDAAGSPTVYGPEITYVSSNINPGTWTALKSNEFQLGLLPFWSQSLSFIPVKSTA